MIFAPINQAKAAKIKGSKNIITKTVEMDLSEVTSMDVSRAVFVEIVADDAQDGMIEISANDNLMQHVEVYVSAGCLYIGMSENIGSIRSAKIKVKVPNPGNIDTFHLATGGRIETTELLQAKSLDLYITSSGRMKIDAVVQNDCNIEITAGSKLELSAKIVGNCTVKASSSSKSKLSLSAVDFYVSASSSADVEADGNVEQLFVTTSSMASYKGAFLKAQNGVLDASSSSTITYYGLSVFPSYESSGGTIKNTKFITEE